MVPVETLSRNFGYLSICCWLCAQLPQVVKNYRLKSCEGLSLPFLVTWLLGDVGNLVGCVLTDQLPFQTYLAAYFCLVDLSLLYQFFYYRAKFQIHHPAALTSRDSYIFTPGITQSLILPPAPPSSPHLRTTTLPDGRPRRHVRTYTEPIYSRTDEHAAVYAAVLDVARAAKRASRTRSRSRRPNSQMHDSIMSDASGRSSSTIESLRHMSASSPNLVDTRGRNMRRTAGITMSAAHPEDQDPPREGGATRDPSRSISVARNSEDRNRGRRKAGVAFMALGCLFTLRQLSSVSDGIVLIQHPDHPPPPPPPSFQHVVGRLSAWACTTLYLSSRLPQIWKNFTRRSVEGLSMYLFLFAFLGNTFYVISILVNPGASNPSESTHYLLEALP
ncbi:PQ loop repeat-domain-containing protein [Kockovaella imperatae]|uniref:PQ loop repeat-domain-containing protein n=1 Tax=Kockovaella imperatae TaxID=4999 RepID=A0A1Y1URY6_9TREE|nr:PQ loop repeat-domain-containing protein [Kockovaella imperatae]ORX39935.1 PQ loop repeat-domain-containing protein [Kockovaella imperatae]